MIKVRTSSGHEIETTGAGLQIFEKGIRGITAPLTKIFIEEMKSVEDYAKKNAPYDMRRPKSKEGKKHFVDLFKIKDQILIIGGVLAVRVSLINTAEYAYMIKTSRKFDSVTRSGSEVPLPHGVHVWSRLMWQPVTKAALKVANRSADAYIRIVQKVA